LGSLDSFNFVLWFDNCVFVYKMHRMCDTCKLWLQYDVDVLNILSTPLTRSLDVA
jgi:hypothetical protein